MLPSQLRSSGRSRGPLGRSRSRRDHSRARAGRDRRRTSLSRFFLRGQEDRGESREFNKKFRPNRRRDSPGALCDGKRRTGAKKSFLRERANNLQTRGVRVDRACSRRESLRGAPKAQTVHLFRKTGRKRRFRPRGVRVAIFRKADHASRLLRHPRNYNRRGIFSIDEPAPTMRGVNRPLPKGYKGSANDPCPVSPDLHVLTSRERSLIQTFPEDFKWVGTKTEVEQMIGNAVPVKLGQFVAETVKIVR